MVPMPVSVIGILLSAAGVMITVITIIKTNAQNQQKMESRFDVVDVRIQTLSDRVEKHNGVMERTFRLEENVRENSHDIVELKTDVREVKQYIMRG